MSDYADLKARLSIKADMIQLGEKIEWGSDSAIMREAAAAIDALERGQERLALAICGGEDAPGYANSQSVETLEKVCRDSFRFSMEALDLQEKANARAEAAEARAKRLREALQNIVHSYEATSELHTSAADCAANLYDHARATLQEDRSHD